MGHKTLNPIHGHWLLAKLGKRVLRPGGQELTRLLIEDLEVRKDDNLIEFAPGVGFTAKILIDKKSRSYTGVDINEEAIKRLNEKFKGDHIHFINKSASKTGLESERYDKIIGEAMLTMRVNPRKLDIIREAYRLLKPGGLYGIHELGLTPNDLDTAIKEEIRRELELTVKVNSRPQTENEWRELLEKEGFKVIKVHSALMRLLEPRRIIQDEGIAQAFKIGYNMMSHPEERKRVLQMRNVFRKHQKHLKAFAFIVKK